jgi:hypothetical protein
MRCNCDSLPDLFKLDSRQGFESGTERVAVGNWVRLHRCAGCGQLWRLDEWDKYQTRFAVRIPSFDGWEAFDATPLQKAFLVQARGGLTGATCIWAGCGKLQVKGVVYCADHLFQTGARE